MFVLIDQLARVFGIGPVCPYLLHESCVCLQQLRVCNIPICIDFSWFGVIWYLLYICVISLTELIFLRQGWCGTCCRYDVISLTVLAFPIGRDGAVPTLPMSNTLNCIDVS